MVSYAAGCIIVATGIIVWPLIRPSRERLDSQAPGGLAVDALELKPVGDVGDSRPWLAALLVTLVLPLGALSSYIVVGNPASLLGVSTSTQPDDHAVDEQTARTRELADRLKARLEAGNKDPEEWVLLARTYRASGKVELALEAYRQATQHDAPAADILIEHASALIDRNGKRFDDAADALVARALAAEPDNLNALAMAGAGAMQRGSREVALKHWRRLHALIPEAGEDKDRAARLVALAAGENPAPALRSVVPTASPTSQQSQDAAGKAKVAGTVSVSEALRKRVPDGATLFVFARALDGPPMPVAVLRLTPKEFPVAFTLDDSHSMVEGTKLSSFRDMRLVARISAQGNATRRAGDLEGSVSAVALGTNNVRLVVDRVAD